jgi:CspA family cold shock protein
MTLIGTVKWFSESKGYGFITPENGEKDVFVHVSALNDSGIKFLKENEKVSFETVNDKGKVSAKNIKKVE